MEKSKKGMILYKTKDNIVKSAKQYTIKGYNMLCNKLFAEHKAIHIYHYITENFINKNYIML